MLTIDRRFVTDILRRFVQIDSVNPALVTGAPGEREIAGYTVGILNRLGLDVTRHESQPGRISVVGRMAGQGSAPSLMLNAHYDTVGVEGMTEPFTATVRAGRLYGRGAYDMKGSLAACLGAVQALREARLTPPGDVLVAAVADEEHASLGTQEVIARHPVNAAIVTEPTGLDICLAHKGFSWIEVETEGRAAHGSKPELGVDANLKMGAVLAELAALEAELRNRAPHPLVGHPSLHAATLQGGSGLSTYAAHCRLQIERRTVPGETEAQVRDEIEAVLDRARKADPELRATARNLMTREPFETRRDAPIVRALAGSVAAALGREPRYVGETPWMDSALLAAAGVDTVVIGPAGAGAHAAEEWVDLESVFQLAEILARTVLGYGGRSESR